MIFTSEEKQRYTRHFSLPEIGKQGQLRIKNTKILCIGAGGLGSPVLLYLSAAGIGTLGIVDDDVVELSNLQRQVLYSVDDIGKPKVLAAQSRLHSQNPLTQIISHQQRLTEENALEIVQDYDIVIDGSDNFATRYIINDACRTLGKPNVYAGISQFTGECSLFMSNDGPCYRCLYANPPPPQLAPNCSQAGVLGVLPGLLGTIQATEALKLALGLPSSLVGKVLRVDALTLAFETFILTSDPVCLLCTQDHAFHDLPYHIQEQCSMIDSISQDLEGITPEELKSLKAQGGDFILLDVREPYEYDICNLEGTLIPLGQLNIRHIELDKTKPIIVHCRTDARSYQAAEFLIDAGFPSVKYLKGGVIAWAREMDPDMAEY